MHKTYNMVLYILASAMLVFAPLKELGLSNYKPNKYQLEPAGPDTLTVQIERVIQNGFPLADFLPHLDALGVFPGLGEDRRYFYLNELLGQATNLRAVLSAGRHPDEQKGIFVKDEAALQRLLGKRAPSKLYVMPSAQHTAHQAEWMVKLARQEGLTSLGLVVSWWHLPRAWRTVIKEVTRYSRWIPIVPIPVPVPFTSVVSETGYTVEQMLPGEIRREKQYTGNVASDRLVLDYLKWLRGNLLSL